MQASEKLFLQTVGRFVIDRIKAYGAPLIARIEKIEAAFAQPRFNETQLAQINALLDARFQHTVGPERVRDMIDNAVGLDVQRMIDEAVAKIPRGPPGKDGENGTNGSDGKSISASDVAGLVAAAVTDAVAALPVQPYVVSGYIDRAGDLYFANSTGHTFKVGHVVGADADTAKIYETLKAHVDDMLAAWPKPKDGKDGFDLDNFIVEFDGERTLTLRFEDAAHSKESKVTLPHPLYRGVWREGTFQRGDEVTCEGSQFIALADTDTRPGTANSAWQLACKRGRDGRPGQPGAPGQPGKDGRDLTQLEFRR